MNTAHLWILFSGGHLGFSDADMPGIGNKMWRSLGRRRKLVVDLSKTDSEDTATDSLSWPKGEDSEEDGDGKKGNALSSPRTVVGDMEAATAEDNVMLALWGGNKIDDGGATDGSHLAATSSFSSHTVVSSNDKLMQSPTAAFTEQSGELAAAAAAAGAARAAAAAAAATAAADISASAKVVAATPTRPPKKRLFDRVFKKKSPAIDPVTKKDAFGESTEAQTEAPRPAVEEHGQSKALATLQLQKLMVDIETEIEEIEKVEAQQERRANKKVKRECLCLVWVVDAYVVVDHVFDGILRQRG